VGKEEVTIGRLRKRIAKLTKQRDHWHAEYDSLSAFFKIYPYIDRHREDHVKRKFERERLRELEIIHAAWLRDRAATQSEPEGEL
jgi:hypothetical protein